jgi:hypothetical protein
MSRKILSFTMVLALFFVLSGCDSGGDDNNGSSGDNNPQYALSGNWTFIVNEDRITDDPKGIMAPVDTGLTYDLNLVDQGDGIFAGTLSGNGGSGAIQGRPSGFVGSFRHADGTISEMSGSFTMADQDSGAGNLTYKWYYNRIYIGAGRQAFSIVRKQ